MHIRSREVGESRKPQGLTYPLGYLAAIVRSWARATLRRWLPRPAPGADVVTAVLALLLCLLLPGVAGGVLLSWSSGDPGRAGSLALRGLSGGVSAWLISSGLLERTFGITKTSAWMIEGLLALASVRSPPAPEPAVLRSALGEAGYFVSHPHGHRLAWLPIGLLLRRTWGPLGSPPWYYWNLAQQVADAGQVPATATEWGTTLPFLDDYRLFSDGTALFLTEGAPTACLPCKPWPSSPRCCRMRRRLVRQRPGVWTVGVAGRCSNGDHHRHRRAAPHVVPRGRSRTRPQAAHGGLPPRLVPSGRARVTRCRLSVGGRVGERAWHRLAAAAVMLVAAGVATITRDGLRRHLAPRVGLGIVAAAQPDGGGTGARRAVGGDSGGGWSRKLGWPTPLGTSSAP